MSARESDIVRPLSGFENISRRWSRSEQTVVVKLLPGDYYVTLEDELITTVLGSCVSACIRDRVLGIGGMNHFMLPEISGQSWSNTDERLVGSATRYGNYAMEHLINVILTHGGKRKNLEVKLFGGGKVLPTMTNVGLRNIDFVLDYIDAEGMNLIAKDLGDIYPRKVNYYPKTGRVRVKKLKNLHNETIVRRELSYSKEIKDSPVEGEIELF